MSSRPRGTAPVAPPQPPSSKGGAARSRKILAAAPAFEFALNGKSTPPLPRAFSAKKSPLLWSIDDSPGASGAADLIVQLHASRKRKEMSGALEMSRSWLAEADGRAATAGFAFECLAWCYLLARLPDAGSFDARDLFEALLSVSHEATAADVSAQPLEQQLLAGELPLVAGSLLAKSDFRRELLAGAGKTLAAGIEELLDGDGMPSSAVLSQLRPLLACWTRCVLLAPFAGISPLLKKPRRRQLQWCVRQALRLTRFDGGAMLSPQASTGVSVGKDDGTWLAAAVECCQDRVESRIAAFALRAGNRRGSRPRAKLPKAAGYSEWAEVALLRSHWGRKSPALAVTFSNGEIHSELNNAGDTLWTGRERLDIEIDGRRLPPGEWAEVCWHSDNDVDYLELEMKLPGDWTLHRQYLLAREDRFLFTADSLTSEQHQEIDFRRTFPLAAGVRFEAAKETREGQLVGERSQALALPLSLPEWRSEPAAGDFSAAEEGLALSMRRKADRLCAALFIDLKPRRQQEQLTWRRLTVGEDLLPVPPNVAVGYRVRVGSKQWLLYRSLAAIAPRTMLGQHLFTEFLAARLTDEGEADELIRVE